MQFPAFLWPLVLRLDGVNQQPPKDDDVVAGWMAFAVFILLCAAVAFLGWSLTRQFKKVRRAQEEGVFGDDDRPEAQEPGTDSDGGSDGGSSESEEQTQP
ncbi:hypothetical protein [Nocardioides sp. KR10-350]|uniref:hypothetical protein n=1 Tax=Nocardioides cheoyonin TaxID=3156615 RepID=UPI0032B5E5FA